MTTNTNIVSNQSFNKNNLLDLELLILTYNKLLIEYQQVYQNYISALTNESSGNSTKRLSIIPDSVFWGSASISKARASTVKECQNRCSAISSCSGATYDTTKSSCWLRLGQGPVLASSKQKVAIVPPSFMYMTILKNLNQEMIALNDQIMTLFHAGVSEFIKKEMSLSSLQQNYEKLTSDREVIQASLEEKQKISNEINDTGLSVNRSYYLYLLFLIITVLAVFFIIGTMMTSNSSNSSYRFIGGSTKNWFLS